MGATVVTGPVFGDGSTGATVVITAPSGIAAGDLLLAYLHSDNDGNTDAMTAPAGWTQISSSADTVSTIGGFGKIWTKTATSSEPGSYSFPGSANSDNTGFMWRITGWNTSAPFAASPIWSNPGIGSTTSLIAPSVTLSESGLLICGFTLEGMFGGSITPPVGMSGTSVSSSSGFVQTLPGLESGHARGSTGTRTATASTSGASDLHGYLTVSLAIADALPVLQAPSARRVRPPIPGRRKRLTLVVPAQVSPAAPAKAFAVPGRRLARAQRRPELAGPPPTQAAPAAPARVQSPGRRILVRAIQARRTRLVISAREQTPTPQSVRAARARRPVLGSRRGTEVTVVPPQTPPLAPAWVPIASRARRVAAILRRGVEVTVVPPQAGPAQALMPPPASLPRWAGRLLRRPESVGPIPPQVAPVPVRVQSPGRVRRVLAIARRGVEVAVVPPQVAPATLAKVPSASSPLRVGLARRRPEIAGPPPPQVAPAELAQVRSPGRFRRAAALSRRGVKAAVPPQTAAPAPGVARGGIRRLIGALRRPEAVTPVPVQSPAPPQVDSPRPPPRSVHPRRGRVVSPIIDPAAAPAAQTRSVRRRIHSLLLRRGRRGGYAVQPGAPDFRVPKAPLLAPGRRSGPTGTPGVRAQPDSSPAARPGPTIEGGQR